jgi:hypothetical protein
MGKERTHMVNKLSINIVLNKTKATNFNHYLRIIPIIALNLPFLLHNYKQLHKIRPIGWVELPRSANINCENGGLRGILLLVELVRV